MQRRNESFLINPGQGCQSSIGTRRKRANVVEMLLDLWRRLLEVFISWLLFQTFLSSPRFDLFPWNRYFVISCPFVQSIEIDAFMPIAEVRIGKRKVFNPAWSDNASVPLTHNELSKHINAVICGMVELEKFTILACNSQCWVAHLDAYDNAPKERAVLYRILYRWTLGSYSCKMHQNDTQNGARNVQKRLQGTNKDVKRSVIVRNIVGLIELTNM